MNHTNDLIDRKTGVSTSLCWRHEIQSWVSHGAMAPGPLRVRFYAILRVKCVEIVDTVSTQCSRVRNPIGRCGCDYFR
jgi:hypothetical protein